MCWLNTPSRLTGCRHVLTEYPLPFNLLPSCVDWIPLPFNLLPSCVDWIPSLFRHVSAMCWLNTPSPLTCCHHVLTEYPLYLDMFPSCVDWIPPLLKLAVIIRVLNINVSLICYHHVIIDWFMLYLRCCILSYAFVCLCLIYFITVILLSKN
jgi:hypothetical protein